MAVYMQRIQSCYEPKKYCLKFAGWKKRTHNNQSVATNSHHFSFSDHYSGQDTFVVTMEGHQIMEQIQKVYF